jgi:replication factor A1
LKVTKLDKVLPGVHGFNAYVKIEEVSRTEVKRFDGTTLIIAEGLCGDDTGVIRFRVAGGRNLSRLIGF